MHFCDSTQWPATSTGASGTGCDEDHGRRVNWATEMGATTQRAWVRWLRTKERHEAATGGGSKTLTVGDENWTFEPVLCALGPEEIGQEGAEFVLSSIQDGEQMFVSIDVLGLFRCISRTASSFETIPDTCP